MKKIIVTALLSVCMSLITICASAATIDETKDKLVAFGMIDSDFDVDGPLTRAEFADIIARFFSEDTYNYSKEQIFRDVDTNYPLAESINKSAHYGIFSGVGGNKFMPDEEIDRSAMQIALVKLLGYSVKAEFKGGSLKDYTTVAGELGLTSGIPAGATIAETALFMIDNALDIYVTEPNLSGSGITVSNEKTLMNKALGIYKISGVMKGAKMKALDVKYQSDSESVLVNALRMETDNVSLYADFVGFNVDAYYHEENDIEYIVWCKERKNSVKTIKLSNIVKIENNIVLYEDGDRHKTLKLNDLPYVIYNNRPTTAIPTYSENGTIKFIDTGAGYNTVEIKDYTTYVVESINESTGSIITKLAPSAIELEDYEYSNVVDKDMKELKLKDFEEDDIISVMVDLEKTSIEIIKSTGVVSGTVDEINLAEHEITIDGTVYVITESFAEKLEAYKISSLSAYVGEFRLDICGNIANFDMQINEGSRVGYLIKVMMYEHDHDTRPIARILTDTGDIKEYRMRIKNGMIRVDGVATDAVTFKNNHTSNAGVFLGDLITYSLNSQGEVKEIDIAEESGNKGLHLYKTVNNARYRRDTYSFYNDAVLSEDVVIFHIPKEEEYKENPAAYALLTTWSFNNGGKYSGVKLYTFDEEPMSADVVIYEAKIGGEGSNAYPALVTKIKSGLNVDDETVDYLESEMYSGSSGAESIAGGILSKTKTPVKGEEFATDKDVGKGDIVVYDTNFFGETSTIKLLYDCETGDFYNTNPYMLNDYQMTYSFGTVERREGDLLKLKLKDTSNYEYYRVPNTCKIFVVNDASSSNLYIEKGTINDVRTVFGHGNERASKVFIQASYNTPQFIVIYND